MQETKTDKELINEIQKNNILIFPKFVMEVYLERLKSQKKGILKI